MRKMIEKMEQEQYCESFKNALVELWKQAEDKGLPPCYYADRGSLALNGLDVSNGVGDGRFYIDVVYSSDDKFEEMRAKYHSTGITIFSDSPLKIRLYDCLPESEFTCKLEQFKFADLMVNDEGDFLIACF